ncbi:MAG: 2'-5' RNA ligase family protein [Actinomycetales bacterium]|nr:2'-5' RNA ligase family protein [Actinomycetales bacterium]
MAEPGSGHTIGIAVEIPEPYGSQLDAVRAEYAQDPDEMPAHVTILPPVDIDDDLLDTVIAHLATVAGSTEPFRLVLRGTGTFRPVSPVVFVAVAEGISRCEQLERHVRSGALAVETRFPYHPHVTIAHDVADADLDEAFEKLEGFYADVQIDRLSLRELREGRWQMVREFVLGG